MNLRCFVAIEISDAIKKEIGEIVDNLEKYDADVKWVASENVHLTLKFLGNTSDSLIPKIQEALLHAVSSFTPFYIKIYGTGVFPNRKYPRVIWVGVESSLLLRRLAGGVEDSMLSLGFKKESKEFNPHLTLGRVRSRSGVEHIINEIGNIREKDFGNIYVDNIKLMKSDLKPKGAEYIRLHTIPLGGA
jgi:2'-5' RNA ligase